VAAPELESWQPVTEQDVAVTGVVAMAVRHALEDFYAGGNLDHGQMAVLNRIIRNAILTALYAVENSDDVRCAAFVKFCQFARPSDWETPELLESLTSLTDGMAVHAVDEDVSRRARRAPASAAPRGL